MSEIPRIESVMTTFVLSVEIDDTLRIAEDRMIDNEVRHLAVTDAGELVGVISDRDLGFLANSPEAGLRDRLRVRDVCSLELYAVGVDEPLDRVLEQMVEQQVGSVLILDGEKLAGVFTVTDVCRCFADFLQRGSR